MSEVFTNILTIKGQQKKALAEANITQLNITTFKVGDGNGSYYEPTENQTALKNPKYTGTFTAGTQSQIIINPSATNEVLYKCFIPADVGGFTIRELGLFDSDGDLILICKLPAQDKFALASGLYQPLTFTPKIIYTNPETQAVLTPTSQNVPTTAEVSNMIETIVSESLAEISYYEPLENTNKAISLKLDDTLKVSAGRLGITKTEEFTRFSINSGNTKNGEADLLSFVPLPYSPWESPIMTSYTAPSGTITCNGNPQNGDAWRFLGNYDANTYINMNQHQGTVWLKYSIGQEVYLNEIWTPTNGGNCGYGYPNTWSFTVNAYYKGFKVFTKNYGLTQKDNITAVLVDAIEVVPTSALNPDWISVGAFKFKGYTINPNGGSSDHTTLSFIAGGSYSNLVLTYADKSQETLTSLDDITGLSTNGNYAIIKEKGQNPLAINTTGVLNGTAISGGDYSGYPKENAFDGSARLIWASSQVYTAVSGNAYIGKSFAASKTIHRINLLQDKDISYVVTSVKVQSSTNGTTWVDVQTFNTIAGMNVLILSTPLATQYIRVLANSNLGIGAPWRVLEISFNQNFVTQGKTFPTLPSDGDYHCLTEIELKTYKHINGAWVETQYVQIGSVVVADGAITSATTNPYNQNGLIVDKNTAGALTKCWISDEYTITLGVSINIAHNLNLNKSAVCIPILVCKSAVEGYAIGDEIQGPFLHYCGSNTQSAAPILSTNSVYQPVGNAYAFFISNKAGTSYMVAANVPAGFKYKVKIFY